MTTLRFLPALDPDVQSLWASTPPTSMIPQTDASIAGLSPESAFAKSRRIERGLRYRTAIGWEQENAMLEEAEARVNASVNEIRTFGYSWMIPFGKKQTQEEETDNGDLAGPTARQPMLSHPPAQQLPANGSMAATDAEMTTSGQDLDASVEDRDQSSSYNNSFGPPAANLSANTDSMDEEISQEDVPVARAR